MKYVCSRCHREESITTRHAKCACGGLWRLDYRPPAFTADDIDRAEWSQFRYHRYMALNSDAWRAVSMGEGMTPVIRFDDNVLLKMDYLMPTLSFKDRGAAVLVAHCKSIGVEKVVQDSSGNAGNSVAAYCARAGIACEIFVPEGTSPKKINMIEAHGAIANVVPGSRDHCADVCRAKVEAEGVYYANHVYNPFFYEGTKTYIYEVYEQLGRIPQHLIIPVGNGTLFLGVMQALEHLLASGVIAQMPTIIAVQSEYCDPLLRAAVRHEREPAAITPQPPKVSPSASRCAARRFSPMRQNTACASSTRRKKTSCTRGRYWQHAVFTASTPLLRTTPPTCTIAPNTARRRIA